MSNIGNYVPLPGINEIEAYLVDFTVLQLERASSQGGAYSLLTTITLVANDPTYAYQDTTGAITDWYRYRPYNSTGPVAGPYCDPFPALQAPVVTRLELVRRAARRVRMYATIPGEHTFPGPSGTTSGAGSTTTVVCSSYADTEYPDRQYKDHYLRMTSGTDSGQERRIASLDETTGTFTVSRAFTGTPGTSATFEIWGGLTGDEWRSCLNQALLDLWTPFRWPLATVDGQTQYTLPYWIEGRKQIHELERVSGTTIREHTLYGGNSYLIKPLEGGGAYIYLPNHGADVTFELTGDRHPAAMFSDTDTIVMSEINQRTLITGTAALAARLIGQESESPYWAELSDALERERQGYARREGGSKIVRSPRTPNMVSVGGYRRGSGTSRYYS